MKSRREKILGGIALRGLVGVEIGPLDKPLISKEESQVIYVDHKDTASLRQAWSADPSVDTSKIHVDAVWGAATLEQAIGNYARRTGMVEPLLLDYVVASHVIEHVPDLVTWLKEIRAILKPGGELRLAVPDRRFTFDFLRRTSDLTAVLTAYVSRARVPSAHCVLDFGLNMAPVDCALAWQGKIDANSLQKRFSVEEAIKYARESLENGAYFDVHCWVFTPESFGKLFADLARCGLLDFACTGFHDTSFNEFEFMVALRVCDDAREKVDSWQRMAATANPRLPF